MNETIKYLNIMIESLEKKEKLMTLLLEKTEAQGELIAGKEYDDVNWAQFTVYMNEKESAINKIDELDEGFDQVYKRVQPDLDEDAKRYKDQIKKLQVLITSLTDVGVKISAKENRNKTDIDRIMTAAKANIRSAKKNIKVSNDYIKSMYGNANVAGMNMFDSKK